MKNRMVDQMKILVINGPNLNMLGKRKPEVYGKRTLAEINGIIAGYFKRVKTDFFQSNHEGAIIDKLHEAGKELKGVVINPGAFTHYSYAIRDAIEACGFPVVEVHISNTAGREEFRKTSVISDVCKGTVSGFGTYSYILGIQALAHHLKRREND